MRDVFILYNFEIMKDQLLDTWRINCKVNLMILDSLNNEALNATLSPRGRNVATQLGHLHNVRLMWLDVLAKDLLTGTKKIEKENSNDKKLLKKQLELSEKKIAELISRADDDGKIKGYKKGVVNLLAYFVSHESHHRGSILLTLKQTGHKVEQSLQYGIWEWSKL